MNTNALQTQIPVNRDSCLKSYSDQSYVLGLAKHFQEQIADHSKTLYFITTTYLDSREFPLTAVKANQHLKRFHQSLLSYLADSHRFNKPRFRAIEPTLYAFMDVPGSKSKDYKRTTVPAHGSTFHHHSILIANRAHVPMLDALTDKMASATFVLKNSRRSKLRSLDVQRIADTEADIVRVTDYATAHARKHQRDAELFQIYPISESEFQSKTRHSARTDTGTNELRPGAF